MEPTNKKITEQRPGFGLWLWKRTLLQLLQKLAKVSGSGIVKWRPPAEQTVTICCSKGFPGGTLKSIKRLRDGSFLVECGKRAQAQNLLRTNRFTGRPVRVSIHKTLNSSRGAVRCRDLADMTEVEIRDELKDQGVVGMNRVTLKKEGKVIPTNTLFLTFGSPKLPKEITVGYLKVKVALFIPNPMLQLQLIWTDEPKLQGCCKVYGLWKR